MKYDLVIVGGAMVGGSLAIALEHSKLRIALLDATPESAFDPRLIALNLASCSFLKNLGLWPELKPHAEAIQEVHISERGHFGMTHLEAHEFNLPALGYLIPAIHINNALTKKLATAQTITSIRPARLKNLRDENNGLILTLDNGEELTTNFLIGADGSHSSVRVLANIPSESFDYHQSALVTITDLQRSHQQIAYERFTGAGGTIAMLPLAQCRVATIWTSGTEAIERLNNLSPEKFLQELQTQFGYRLGRFVKIGERYVYPLQKIVAKNPLKDSVLLIGNAAHTLHPIAAQGLNLALRDVAALASIINRDGISRENLQKYLNEQITNQSYSIRFSDQVVRLFSTDWLPLKILRNLGITGLNFCPLAKQKLARRIMGRAGKLPELCATATN